MNDLIKRQHAAQAVLKEFQGKPLSYGRRDCVRMGFVLLRKRGHRPTLGRAGTYNSALSAARALKASGHASIADALDAMGLERIAPAAALAGDLIMLEGEGPFGGALTMAVGNGRVLGYHQDCVGAEILQPEAYLAAWRT